MKHSLSYVAVATLFASAPVAALAQETATPNEIIVTASRIGLEPREIGSAFSVIDQTEIDTKQVLFAKDILEDVPGVQITSDRPGDFTSVSIRGSDNDQVLFLIDGMKLGDPSAISTQFQADHLTSLDIAKIEVLRGNQSSLYGSDAIGGVVNIITQRATEDGFKVNAEAEGGSYGTYSGGVSVFGKNGPLDFRLSATGFSADGPSVADPKTGPATEDDSYSRWSLSGRAGYKLTETVELQAMGFYNDADSDLDATNADSDDTVRTKEGALGLKLVHKSLDGVWGNTLSMSRYDVERRYFGVWNLPDGDAYEGTRDNFGYTLNVNPTRRLGLAAGVSYEEETTAQLTSFSGQFDAGIDTRSVFGEIALYPVDGVSLTAAARLDDNNRFGQFDTYRVTAAYVPSGTLAGAAVKFRASFGTGAKSPGLYQLFDPNYGNANLTTAESKGVDAGIDLAWDRAHLQITAFQTKVENEIGFGLGGGPLGLFGYLNLGETETKGVEFGADYRVADWLTLAQSFTVLDAQDALAHTWLGKPRYSGVTTATLAPTDKWSFTARVRYRSKNNSSFGGTTDSYATGDLLASYRLNDHIELYGRVVNVTDEFYEMSYGINTAGRSGYVGVRARY